MKKYHLLVTLFLFGCICCRQGGKTGENSEEDPILTVNTDSVINVNLNAFVEPKEFDYISLIKKIKLVPLETTDESLVSDINQILVTDSNIYIFDSFKGGGIIIFDGKGKLIKRLPNGPGPGELSELHRIAYDKENNELIARQFSSLSFYTSEGEFIRHVEIDFAFVDFCVLPDGYLFKTFVGHGNEYRISGVANYQLYVSDKDFKIKSVGLPYFYSENITYGSYRGYLYNGADNTVKVTQPLSDTIYQFQKPTGLTAVFALNYNKKKIPLYYLKGDVNNFNSAMRNNDFYFYNAEYEENTTHNVFFLGSWYTNSETIIYRDKKTGNLIGGNRMIYKIGEPEIGFPVASKGDFFISYFYPDEYTHFLSASTLLSDEDKGKIINLKEDDNPVLVFYSLKDF